MGERLRTNAPSHLRLAKTPRCSSQSVSRIRAAWASRASAELQRLLGAAEALGHRPQHLGLVHEQRVQPDVGTVEGVCRRDEPQLVVDRRVVVEGLVHRGEARVHEVPVADRRGSVFEDPVAVAVSGGPPPAVGVPQHRVGAFEEGGVAEALAAMHPQPRALRTAGVSDPPNR